MAHTKKSMINGLVTITKNNWLICFRLSREHPLWKPTRYCATRSPKSFSERVFSFYAMYINQLFFVVKGQGRRRVWANRGAQAPFLTVGLAITDFINFTTIIYRVSAMDLEIEPMGPKIRLWPCGARRANQTRPVEILRAHRHTGRRPSCPSVGWAITDFINFTTIIYRINIERDSWRWWGLWKRLRAPQSAVACRLSEAPSPFLPFTSCVFGI